MCNNIQIGWLSLVMFYFLAVQQVILDVGAPYTQLSLKLQHQHHHHYLSNMSVTPTNELDGTSVRHKRSVTMDTRSNILTNNKIYTRKTSIKKEKTIFSWTPHFTHQKGESATLPNVWLKSVGKESASDARVKPRDAYISTDKPVNVRQSRDAYISTDKLVNVRQSRDAYISTDKLVNVRQSRDAYISTDKLVNVRQSRDAYISTDKLVNVRQSRDAYISTDKPLNSRQSRDAYISTDKPVNVRHIKKFSGGRLLSTKRESSPNLVALGGGILSQYGDHIKTEQHGFVLNTTERTSCRPTNPSTVDSYSCHGDNVTDIPRDLPANISKLLMGSSPMTILAKEAFIRYSQLAHIELRNFTGLSRIERGAFYGLLQLRILIIIDCRNLKTIGRGVFGLFQSLDILRITKTGLTSIPDFSGFGTLSKAQNNSMFEIDLSANKIRHIRALQFSGVKTYELRVQNNLITSIEDRAFDGAVITRLLCKNNFNLRHLGNLAFKGIQEFHYLDLSRSEISELPTEGLINIRQLVLEGTPSLKKFPSVFKFSEINVARLTYEHHCCAFRHAAKQDPVESSLAEQSAVASACAAHLSQLPTTGSGTVFSELPQTTTSPLSSRVKRSLETLHAVVETFGSYFVSTFDQRSTGKQSETGSVEVRDAYEDETRENIGPIISRDIEFLQPTTGPIHKPGDNFGVILTGKSTKTPIDPGKNFAVPDHLSGHGQVLSETGKDSEPHRSPTGSWHDKPQPANSTTKWVTCGNFSSPKDYSHVICTPRPNPFNPCEDVMGYEWLRVFVWLVLLAALGGNLVVMVVLLSARSKLTVPKFLMCNLSFADFLMGLYLLLIASVDVHFLGEYFTHAVSWQNDGGCQVAGFLTVFSSELSVFVLTVITLERWYAISQAIHVNKRLRMRQATCLMFAGWVYASSLAVLPLLGVSGYGAVSICLPMEAKDPLDIVYIILLLVFNGIAFTAICGCYISMFLKVRASENMARSNDATIAKRMAILVLTNFICWAPIAFFGLTASFGFPLIDITNSKVLLVFFYPFNSCANPFLYAILTKQFRKDVFILLGRYGLCTDRANRYKGTSVTRSYSYNSRHNNGLMVGGHHRYQPSASDVSILSQYCRTGSRGSRGSLFSQSGTGWGSSTPTRMSRAGSSKDNLSRSGLHRLSSSGTSSLLESSLESFSLTNQNVLPGRSLKNTSLSQSPLSGSPPACTRAVFQSSRTSSPTNNSSSNGSEGRSSKSERKLSTVLETSHASSEPLSDDGCGIVGVFSGEGEMIRSIQYSHTETPEAVREERILQGRDSLRDLFEGQPHGRVRSASEYVVIFKAAEESGIPASASIASTWEKNYRVLETGQNQRLNRGSETYGYGSACERRISRDTVLSNNTVSSLLSSNTVSSVASQPVPSSNQASDTEQHNPADKKRTRQLASACVKKLHSRQLFQLEPVETVGSLKQDNARIDIHATEKPIKKAEAHAFDNSTPFSLDDDMALEQLTTSFLEFDDDDSLSFMHTEQKPSYLENTMPSEKVLQEETNTVGNVNSHSSHTFNSNQKTGSLFENAACYCNDQLIDETFDIFTSPKVGNFPSLDTRPSLEATNGCQPSRNTHETARDARSSSSLKCVKPQTTSEFRPTGVSWSERDGLLGKSNTHNGTFNTRTWPVGAIVEEDDEDEEDEDLEREVRVRERRRRRKKRKKLKSTTMSYGRVGTVDESKQHHQADTDHGDDLGFLESLLQAV